ncbi:MAG: porin, partial [Pirellulaceae bacterium]
PTQKWSGRIHWDYWGFPEESDLANAYETGDPNNNPNDRFTFRRVRFGVAGDILETMLYKIEMEFANPNDPAFKDVYIGWKELPVLQTVLLGNQKRPYGLDHLNSSRYNVFLERPFIIEAVNQDARRFGLCAYGVSDDERWNWRYGTFLMEDIQADGDYTSDDYQMELAGRLANTIWYDETSDGRGYAHWAVSGTLANPYTTPDGGASNQARFRTRPEARTVQRWYDTSAIPNADTYQMIGFEGAVNVGPLQVVGEYQHVNVNRNNGANDLQFGGGYVYVAYFLTGEHTPWERDTGTLGRVKPFENFFLVNRCRGGVGGGWGAWQIAARYSYADFTDDTVFGGVGESFTAGVNWWWTPYSRVQFNYITGEINQGKRATDLGNPPVTVIPAGGSGHYDIFGARFMVDF